MNQKYKFLLISFLILLIISILFFWKDIKTKYFFLAYKEKCLIVLSKEKNNYDLYAAKDICECIVREMKINKDKLNTSKLFAINKIEIPPAGLPIPIDEGFYKRKCIKKY